jgi:hypothetical protein
VLGSLIAILRCDVEVLALAKLAQDLALDLRAARCRRRAESTGAVDLCDRFLAGERQRGTWPSVVFLKRSRRAPSYRSAPTSSPASRNAPRRRWRAPRSEHETSGLAICPSLIKFLNATAQGGRGESKKQQRPAADVFQFLLGLVYSSTAARVKLEMPYRLEPVSSRARSRATKRSTSLSRDVMKCPSLRRGHTPHFPSLGAVAQARQSSQVTALGSLVALVRNSVHLISCRRQFRRRGASLGRASGSSCGVCVTRGGGTSSSRASGVGITWAGLP